MNILTLYFNSRKIYLFAGIVFSNLLIIWLSKTFLINDIVFYNTYSEQLTYERSEALFENMKSTAWIGYAFLPIILLIKFSLVSLIIYVGAVFYGVHKKITLSSIFKIVIACEIVFVFAGILKFLWFYLFAGNYNLYDLGFFSPLSLINLFKRTEIDRFWIYPLQTINLFHLSYIVSITYGLSKISKIDRLVSDKVVLASYIPGLLLWIVLIMFLTISTSA